MFEEKNTYAIPSHMILDITRVVCVGKSYRFLNGADFILLIIYAEDCSSKYGVINRCMRMLDAWETLVACTEEFHQSDKLICLVGSCYSV